MHKKSIEASEKLHAAEMKDDIDDSQSDSEDFKGKESRPSSEKNTETEKHCD